MVSAGLILGALGFFGSDWMLCCIFQISAAVIFCISDMKLRLWTLASLVVVIAFHYSPLAWYLIQEILTLSKI